MVIGKFKINELDFTFVFRHRFEKDENNKLIDKFTMWREWELGLFYKRWKIVGKKDFNKPKKWKNNLIPEYMLGINLLLCKAWFTVSKGGMDLSVNEK